MDRSSMNFLVLSDSMAKAARNNFPSTVHFRNYGKSSVSYIDLFSGLFQDDLELLTGINSHRRNEKSRV